VPGSAALIRDCRSATASRLWYPRPVMVYPRPLNAVPGAGVVHAGERTSTSPSASRPAPMWHHRMRTSGYISCARVSP